MTVTITVRDFRLLHVDDLNIMKNRISRVSLKAAGSKVFLFLVVLILSLGVSEVAIRFLSAKSFGPVTWRQTGWVNIPESSWIEYDAWLGWVHRKNWKSKLVRGDLEIPIATNMLGFRGNRNYLLDKPRGVKRIYADGTLRVEHQPVPADKNFQVAQFPDQLMRTPFERFLLSSYLGRTWLEAAGRIGKNLGWEDPDSSSEWILSRAILKSMTHDIRNHGVEAIVIIVPPARWITGTVEPVRDSLLRFGKREGVRVLDLTPVLKNAVQKQSMEKFYIQDDFHWTAAAHRLVAETLVRHLPFDERFDA